MQMTWADFFAKPFVGTLLGLSYRRLIFDYEIRRCFAKTSSNHRQLLAPFSRGDCFLTSRQLSHFCFKRYPSQSFPVVHSFGPEIGRKAALSREEAPPVARGRLFAQVMVVRKLQAGVGHYKHSCTQSPLLTTSWPVARAVNWIQPNWAGLNWPR